ncbi:MAG: class I SAM-dependent methyltransferase [Oscillospiraceae bacterium]|nr:class I SAM-dependent methyltransferase [Oscillospiraceae bacterium]
MALLFDQKADAYAAGRTGYAPEAVEKLISMMPEGSAAADMGSGTGLFSEQLIRAGVLTFCVEPDDGMRAKAEARLNGDPLFRSVAASAEESSLPDGSVGLVTAAAALHWFDPEGFRRECARILMPDGIVGILNNVRDYDDPLTKEQHALCLRYCTSFTSFTHGFDKVSKRIPSILREYELFEYPFPLEYSVETFVSRGLSSSYSLKQGDPQFEEYVRELKALAEKYAENGVIRVGNKVALFIGKV